MNENNQQTDQLEEKISITALCNKHNLNRDRCIDYLLSHHYLFSDKNGEKWVTKKGKEKGMELKRGKALSHWPVYGGPIVNELCSVSFLALTEEELQDKAKAVERVEIANKFLIFDTETTGLNEDAEAIELGIIDQDGNCLFSSLFKPENPVSQKITQLTGITNKMLKDAPLFKDKVQEILAIVKDSVLIAFNNGFDMRVIQQTFDRYGIEVEFKSVIKEAIDAMAYAKEKLPNEASYKLINLCTRLGISESQDHRAIGDCQLTLAMINKLKERENEMNPKNPPTTGSTPVPHRSYKMADIVAVFETNENVNDLEMIVDRGHVVVVRKNKEALA